MLEILSSLVCSLWWKRQLHINKKISVTGRMLCFIPYICKYEKYHSDIYYRKQVNNVIKVLFRGLSAYKMAVTQYLFWTEYTDFGNYNCQFNGGEFIRKSKDIRDGNSHLWYQKKSLTCTKVLSFQHVQLHQRLLLLVHQSVLWMMLRRLKLVKYLLSAVMHSRNRVLFVNVSALNQLESNNIILIKS